MSKLKVYWIAAIALVSLSAPGSSYALTQTSAEAGSIYIGGPLGLASVSSGGGTHFTIGARGGYKVMPEWSVGGFFNYLSLTSSAIVNGAIRVTGTDSNMYLYGGEGAYHFAGTLEGLRLGGKVGLATVSSGNNSATNLALGPTGAYDFFLAKGLSVGPEVNWMLIAASDSFSVLDAVGVLRFWF